MKKIPYGIDDFQRIIQQDYYYIDKTEYIRTVEGQNSYILFCRPRRMGKSLFVNMLMAYYDINKRDQFQELFQHLAIGKNPTEWANKFVVLKLDFSQVEGDPENLPKKFKTYCMNQIRIFFKEYQQFFTKDEQLDVLNDDNTATGAIVQLVNYCKLKGLHSYLFIDEYDNFTNAILAARGINAHEAITHGDGFYRNFFKGCKGTFERIFMTGISPVTYDDLTSGFHIADIVGLSPRFNQAIGITEQELRDIINYYQEQGAINRSTNEIIEEIKPWYDNFCFAKGGFPSQHSIYNTDMVLRYLKELILEQQSPEVMIDYAARTDYAKLNHLVLSEDLTNRKERIDIVREICTQGYTMGEIEPEFPARECGAEKNFKSMLFYYGTLTYGGQFDGETRLIVPNKTMGDLYLDYMLRLAQDQGLQLNGKYKQLQSAIREAAIDGCWQPMIDLVGELCYDYASVRNEIRGEHDLQGFIRGLLCLNKFYDVWPELELGHGFSDILLVPRYNPDCPTKHSYIIEVKHIGAIASQEKLEKAVAEKTRDACNQLRAYISDHHLSSSSLLRSTPLTPIYLIFHQHKLILSRHL